MKILHIVLLGIAAFLLVGISLWVVKSEGGLIGAYDFAWALVGGLAFLVILALSSSSRP